MKKKQVLEIRDFKNYQVLGVSCHLKDYRFAFYLNKVLLSDFKRLPEFKFNHKYKSYSFSNYYFLDQENMIEFVCLSNKSENNYLSPENKIFDYLIFIHNQIDDDNFEIIKKLRGEKHINLVNKFDNNNIKLYSLICHEIEIHLNNVIK